MLAVPCALFNKQRSNSPCSSTGADMSHNVMDQLSKTPTLRRIRISFGSQEAIGISCCERDDPPEVWAKHGPLFGRPQLHLRALSNLTSLALVEMFGDLPPWQEAIANILSQSPNLQSLIISLNLATYERALTLDSGPHQLQTFTDGLCDIYATKTKHRLRLKRLRLDAYIYCPSLECIEKVLDLSALEEVFIFNQILQFLHFETRIEFLLAEKTPALRKLEFEDFNAEVWEKIESFCDGSRDFMLSFACYNVYDENFDDEHNLYSLFQKHPSAVIYELGLPVWDGAESYVSTLDQLHGQILLRNLSLPLSVPELVVDGSAELEGCVALVATLPNLQGLFLLSYDWREYPAENYASAVLKIATSSSSLLYIRLDRLSWKIHRATEISIVALTESEDRAVAPELFYLWSPIYEEEYLPSTRAI
ncbi:hypothetical protein VHEMI10448 [[Torrubiella] hemipterigena]|uniref:F-box domain-containing protein n=1 Tax=[Torrubiella] hemipterigena TaxID=1531966 RepID=A0A0A1TIS3_9HYPO|nr:hypothetical protein VHEMI10448 [[Torrubiella] hemipterigena]